MQHARVCSLLFETRRTACRGPTARPELLVCGAGACTPGTAPAPVLPPQAARLSQPVKRRIASSQGDLGRGCAAPSAARFFKMLQIPGLRCCATTERHAHLGRACLALKNLWRHLCRYVRRECAAEKRKRREGHRHACRCVRRGVCHNREYSANLQCSHGTPQRRSSWQCGGTGNHRTQKWQDLARRRRTLAPRFLQRGVGGEGISQPPRTRLMPTLGLPVSETSTHLKTCGWQHCPASCTVRCYGVFAGSKVATISSCCIWRPVRSGCRESRQFLRSSPK